ncbi:PfkB family carbohydrate kinase [Subtercola lobariae]|uniref:Ribokinase n=1 Tax=Subtercola lobariae TaxID=1588641 RepID=A0A917BD40_9MICO|nr:PfkB family carbohydrate kinase [Subtercola lobariae]GGF37678.1 ribokinase [Subtercola lobariae]
MGRVFVVGSLNVDSVVRVQRHPLPGETVRGGDLHTFWGGKGANQAVAAAEAGAEVVFVGRVGDDADGASYRARLASRSIDVRSLTVTRSVSTGHALIAVDDGGENTIIVSPGANARVTFDDLEVLRGAGGLDTTDTAYESEPNGMTAADVLLVSLELDLEVVAAAVRIAADARARVVLNLAPFALLSPEVLALADPVVVNELEADGLRASGTEPGSVLVTLGSRGSRWGDVKVDAAAVTQVVDTTGAGDSYCGTLAARLAAGDSNESAMRAASAAAARSVGWAGAQPE